MVNKCSLDGAGKSYTIIGVVSRFEEGSGRFRAFYAEMKSQHRKVDPRFSMRWSAAEVPRRGLQGHLGQPEVGRGRYRHEQGRLHRHALAGHDGGQPLRHAPCRHQS